MSSGKLIVFNTRQAPHDRSKLYWEIRTYGWNTMISDFKLPRTPSWEINKFPVHDVYDDFLSQIYDLIKMQDKCKNKVY